MLRFLLNRRCVSTRAALLLLAFASSAIPLAAQEDTFILNLRDADITTLAEQVSENTGRTLVLAPELSGDVTVISAEALSAEEVWAMFQSILRRRGFIAVQTGPIWEVVPETDALARAALPEEAQDSGEQDLVTRLINLGRLQAGQAVEVLRPLIADTGYIEALDDPNAIIITDTLANVERIGRIAQTFDENDAVQTAVIPFNFADAQEIATAINAVLGESGRTGRISVDASANRLLVRGLPRDIAEVTRLASELDIAPRANPRIAVRTQVFRLAHADAELVAETIQSLLRGGSVSASPFDRPATGTGSQLTFSEPLRQTALGESETEAGQPPLERTAAPPVGQLGFGTDGAPPLAVQAATETNSVIVRGTARQIEEVTHIVRELDVRQPQVMIEAAIVEVTGEVAQRLGVQLGIADAAVDRGFAATNVTAGGATLASVLQTLGSPVSGVLTTGLTANAGGEDFNLLIQALSQSSAANLLSTPSVTTLDNRPATIVVGQNVPFRTGSFATDGNTLVPFETIERRDVGITLEVLPRVTRSGIVRLDIAQEVSSLTNANIAGAADLITNRRVINTTVEAMDRGTIVLGGLITDDRQNVESKVPGLADIPIVGNAFKARRRDVNRRTLFVFMRPTVITSQGEATHMASDRLQRARNAELRPVPPAITRPQTVQKLPLEINGLY